LTGNIFSVTIFQYLFSSEIFFFVTTHTSYVIFKVHNLTCLGILCSDTSTFECCLIILFVIFTHYMIHFQWAPFIYLKFSGFTFVRFALKLFSSYVFKIYFVLHVSLTVLSASIYFCKVINIYPMKLNTISLIQKYIFIFLFFLIVSVIVLLICWKRSSNALFEHSVNTWYSLYNSESSCCEITYNFFHHLQ